VIRRETCHGTSDLQKVLGPETPPARVAIEACRKTPGAFVSSSSTTPQWRRRCSRFSRDGGARSGRDPFWFWASADKLDQLGVDELLHWLREEFRRCGFGVLN
jgi:hypothetical protein